MKKSNIFLNDLIKVLILLSISIPSVCYSNFDFKQYLFDDPSTLSAFIESLNKSTGQVIINGGDSQQPTIPFTFDWGDGNVNDGWFFQEHIFTDLSKNYVIKITAHYSAEDTDTTELIARFVTPSISPITLPEMFEVSIPAAMPSLTTRLYSIPSGLTAFNSSYFDIISRSIIEYILTVAATNQIDFANEDVYLIDNAFTQVALRDPNFGGMYSLWYTNLVAFGIGGSDPFKGTVGYSSFFHEMGHNITLNSPADYYYGGKIDGNANTIFSETMAQIFQHATGYEIINNYQDYGLSEDIMIDIKNSVTSSIKGVRNSYEGYINSGKNFVSWNNPSTSQDETFNTFMTIAYKFFEKAENSGSGYRMPLKRMMELLQLFNEDLRQQYDQNSNNPEADSFRATLMVAGLSYAFDTDLRNEFGNLNFPISDEIFDELMDWVIYGPDSDGDGVPDSQDGCPNDGSKTVPGVCGCGIPDNDKDNDGTPDCNDSCDNDPNKTEPGICGCGVPDTDTDGDGTPDCNDGCDTDPNKTEPSICGCGVADNDTDNDGTADCNDGCDIDPNKTEPGIYGCGILEIHGRAIWYDGNYHEYVIVSFPDEIWDNAVLDSNSILPGYHLATITSQEEQDFILNLMIDLGLRLSEWWIGGYQEPINEPNDELGWTWVTWEPWEYANWGGSEPNGGLIENHVTIDGYSWNDEGSAIGMVQGYIAESETAIELQIPATERTALIDFYNSTNGDNWFNNDGWKSPPLHIDGFAMPGTEGSWHGVVVPYDYDTVTEIHFGNNNLVGNVPASISNFSNLEKLLLNSNNLSGFPNEIINLTSLLNGESDFRWNRLYSSNSTLIVFLNEKQDGQNWQSTQTVAPNNFSTGTPSLESIPLTWNTIDYTEDPGGYEIYVSTNSGGPYTLLTTTANKGVENKILTGLIPCTHYYIRLRTVTYSHSNNQLTLNSEYTDEVPAKTSIVTDIDGDGTYYCDDDCDNDPNKTEPGLCGCGIVDTDTDNDGTPDCSDNCDEDPNKKSPGICGCGVSDIDTDNDGTPDCNDSCDNDPGKTVPGICGCGELETDTDLDNIMDCIDADDDNDGIVDEEDAFPLDDNESLDTDMDGVGDNSDTDDDNDGISDITESEGPNSGDSNNDGVADGLQANVSSLESNNSQGYVTIESPEGTTISGCEVADNPSPIDTPVGIAFDYELFDFTINDVTAGGSVELTMTLPSGGTTPDTYYKYGITPDNQTDHWYEFLYDGETGAIISGNVITLHFTDALRGDDILIQDSMIIDQGGPGFFTPVATITYPASNLSITAGESVNFECSVTSGNEPLTYSWVFGGGAADSTQRDPANVTFQTAGTYTVTLTVTDVNTDADSDTVTIYVDTLPADNDGNGDDGGGGGGGDGCFVNTL